MSLSEKVEQLARMVPGVSGYQDKESSRDTDKNIRLRVATELEQLKRNLEDDKRQLMNKKDLSLLPALDRVGSQLDKLANTVRYASRGYSGVFDSNKLDVKKLDQLCTFDLQLMDGLSREVVSDTGGLRLLAQVFAQECTDDRLGLFGGFLAVKHRKATSFVLHFSMRLNIEGMVGTLQ